MIPRFILVEPLSFSLRGIL